MRNLPSEQFTNSWEEELFEFKSSYGRRKLTKNTVILMQKLNINIFIIEFIQND